MAMGMTDSILLRRLDSMADAIRNRESWEQIEWHYDHVRSAAEKSLGIRERAYDPKGN